MEKYKCLVCQFSTNHKPNFERHIRTKKHKKNTKNIALFSNHIALNSSNIAFYSASKPLYQCKYCDKVLQHQSSLSRHIKYSCKKNKDEDLKELARLFNEKEKMAKDNELMLLMEKKDKQLENMQKQIDKLTNKLQIQNMNNGIVNNGTVNNNTINIQLLNHKDTDYSHLTHNDYMACISNCNKCVTTLIEKVHFNPNKPENMNIYLSNIKGKYIMIYKDNEWQIQNKKVQVDDLYDHNEMVLETWYDEYKEKYPHIVHSFKRYLKNRDGDVLLNQAKEEILMMMYNKRKMIPDGAKN